MSVSFEHALTQVKEAMSRSHSYGPLLRPCTEEEIAMLRRRFAQELGTSLPADLEAFYRTTKGVNYNGAFFWLCNTDKSIQPGEDPDVDRSWREGVIERSLSLWDMTPHNRPLIQVGYTEEGWLVYDPRTKDYAELQFSGEIMYRFKTFDELFAYTFQHRLT